MAASVLPARQRPAVNRRQRKILAPTIVLRRCRGVGRRRRSTQEVRSQSGARATGPEVGRLQGLSVSIFSRHGQMPATGLSNVTSLAPCVRARCSRVASETSRPKPPAGSRPARRSQSFLLQDLADLLRVDRCLFVGDEHHRDTVAKNAANAAVLANPRRSASAANSSKVFPAPSRPRQPSGPVHHQSLPSSCTSPQRMPARPLIR